MTRKFLTFIEILCLIYFFKSFGIVNTLVIVMFGFILAIDFHLFLEE